MRNGSVKNGYRRVHVGAIASRTRSVDRVDNQFVAATWGQRADTEALVSPEPGAGSPLRQYN